MKDFLRNNGVLILIIAVLLTLIVAVTSALMGGVADPLSNLVGIVTTPVRNGVNAVANWTEEQYQRLFLQDQMQAEYEQLKRDYAKLEEQLREAESDAEENERLRNLLGLREPAIYGSQNYESLLALIRAACDAEGIEVGFVQSNHEGAIVDAIQAAYGVYDGIVINPAAYTHTSVAILDALKAVAIPAVEVHISDVDSREPFRQVSYAGMACVKTYKGLGFQGYVEAVKFLKDYLSK